MIYLFFFFFQGFSSKMQEAEFQSSGQNNIKLFIVLSVHKIHLFPPRIIIYYSHVKIYPILEKHFWLLLSLLPIMIHKELLKKKKKNHTNFRSKTNKKCHTHMEYTSDFYYTTSYYIVWPPPLLLSHFELKIGQKIIGKVLGFLRMLNYR